MGSLRYIAQAFICGLLFGTSCTIIFIYSDILVETSWRPMPAERDLKEVVANSTLNAMYDDKEPWKIQTVVTTANDYAKIRPTSDRDDSITAAQLHDKVRVLCWIMTSPMTLRQKAVYVRDTWSKRCNIRLFISSVEDEDFPAVGVPVKEGRDQLYEKTKAAFRYVWEHYKDKADWFMKADDDTYVIVENLRYLLKDYDPRKPIFFGRKFKLFVQQGYMSGGAGYVLSREALKMYIAGLDSKKCKKGGGLEDVEIARCLSSIGVEAGDSRDARHRETFHPLDVRDHLLAGQLSSDFWLWKYNYYPMCLGKDCSSNYPISFHYVSPQDMHVYEYFIYTLHVYGVSRVYQRYPKLPFED